MLTLKTEKEVQLTVKNILAACRDISKLNKRGYSFLYLCSGFIAHYNLAGFQDAYAEKDALRDAILMRRASNQWDNFRVGTDKDALYYHQKRDIYNAICAQLASEFNRAHFQFMHIKN